MKHIKTRDEILNEKTGEVEYPQLLANHIYADFENVKEKQFSKTYTWNILDFVGNSWMCWLGKYIMTCYQKNDFYEGDIAFDKDEINDMKRKSFPDCNNIDITIYVKISTDNKAHFEAYADLKNWYKIGIGLPQYFMYVTKSDIEHELIHAMQYFNSLFIQVAKDVMAHTEISKKDLPKILNDARQKIIHKNIYGNRKSAEVYKTRYDVKDYHNKEREYKAWLFNFLDIYEGTIISKPMIYAEILEYGLMNSFLSTAIEHITKYSQYKKFENKELLKKDIVRALRGRVGRGAGNKTFTQWLFDKNMTYEQMMKDYYVPLYLKEYENCIGKKYDFKRLEKLTNESTILSNKKLRQNWKKVHENSIHVLSYSEFIAEQSCGKATN